MDDFGGITVSPYFRKPSNGCFRNPSINAWEPDIL